MVAKTLFMLNTIITTNNETQTSDLSKRAFVSLAPLALSITIPVIIYFLMKGHYWCALTIGIGAAILVFQIWSVVFRGHYYSNLNSCCLISAILVALAHALQHHGSAGLFWTYTCIVSLYFILPKRQAWIANAAIVTVVLFFTWGKLELYEAINFFVSLLFISFSSAMFLNIMLTQQRKLQLQAATDSLTGLLNRTILYESLEQAAEQNRRKGLDMTIISFDIDHFKAINDTYGHNVGDSVLQNLGSLLQQRVRLSDKVFRTGGEEFLILLFGTDLENGQKVAEELRQSIESAQLLKNHPITVSLGVATLGPDEDWAQWVKRSDEYLYIAKSNGRNKVVYRSANTNLDSEIHLVLN